ncbi:MAG: transaldolase family protein [Chloroflexia bacterium]|nr:transaldolase family protein [Chloroflexia bacterium]
MEIYLDTANVQEIRHAARLGLISGVTTNPSLMAREEGAAFKETVQEICYIVQGPLSAEVVSLEPDDMVQEAKRIATWSPYVVIKVPLVPQGLEAIHRLSQTYFDDDNICAGCPHQEECPTGVEMAGDLVEGRPIPTNATLCFSVNQGLMAAVTGATYVSPFVGRLDDIGQDGMEVVEGLSEIYDLYGFETRLIAASIRHPRHITRAALAGADIATVPYGVLMKSLRHPLTDIGVERFLADWQAAQGS